MIALAIPYVGLHGTPLAGRDAVIFITFVVILITLVVQGSTLAPVIRPLGIVGGKEEIAEERRARAASIRAGAQALARLESAGAGETKVVAELRSRAARKLQTLEGAQPLARTHLQLRLAMIAAEREAVITMRDDNEISDAVMRRLLREFDREEVLLHQRYADHA